MVEIPAALRGAVWRILGALLLWAAPVIASPAAQSPETQHAGLVIVHAEGRVITQCVAFDTPTLSGLELLQRAGVALTLDAGGLGAAVCALEGAGCPSSDCFCACKGAPCAYWTYHRRAGDVAWGYSNLGAATTTVRNGDVDAWVWGSGASPPDVDFSTICAEAPPPLSATPSPIPASPPQTESPPPATGDYGAFWLLAGGLLLLTLFHSLRRR